MIRATRKNTRSCVVVSVTSFFGGEEDQRCKKWGEISLEQRVNEEGIQEERSSRHSDGEMGTASRHQRHVAKRGGWPRCHKASVRGQQQSGDPAGGLGTAEWWQRGWQNPAPWKHAEDGGIQPSRRLTTREGYKGGKCDSQLEGEPEQRWGSQKKRRWLG